MAAIKSGLVMDPMFVAICSDLGKTNSDTKKYEKSDECDKVVCQIFESLKKDDGKSRGATKEFSVRRSISQLGVVVNDLIPLLKEYCEEDESLFKAIILLLQNLTAPTILLYQEIVPTEKLEKQRYLELVEINRSIKIAFGSSLLIWKPFFKYMKDFIELSWENRNIDRREDFQRLLIFIRNILKVPLDSSMDRSVQGESNPQDRLIDNLHKAGILDLILMLVGSEEEVTDYCFHILEIASALLREQSPQFLAKCYDPNAPQVEKKSRSNIEKEQDDLELQHLVMKERRNDLKTKQFYTRFKEATFQVTNMKSLSDKNLIVHKIPQNLEFTTLGFQKQNARKSKIHANLMDTNFSSSDSMSMVSRNPPQISRILSQFCHEFLKSYNMLMEVTDMNLARSKANSNDETLYLWAAYFFMEFNRFSQPDVSLVSQTFSVKAMHDFHTQIDSYMAKLTTEKKVFIHWSRRLHHAFRAYRELIFTLGFSIQSKNQEFAEVNNAVKMSLFNEDDYRELILKMIKDFNPVKMSRSFLVDLVMTNHIFLKLFKIHCDSQPKIEVKPKKPRKKLAKRKAKPEEPEDLNQCWDNLETGLMAALEGLIVLPSAEDDEDVMPLDPTVEFEDNVQKLALSQRINWLLKEQKTTTAVALLRNCREAWPDEDNLFAAQGSSVEEEMEALKKLLHFESTPNQEKEENNDEDEEKGNGSDQDEVQNSSKRKTNQVSFDSMFKKFCRAKIIQSYALLLNDFENNSIDLNHAIVKMYHKVAVDQGLYGMFFQASLFRIFQNILKVKENERTKELINFAKFIIRKFVTLMSKNEMLLVELLFWKSGPIALQLSSGYTDSRVTREDDLPIDENE